MILPAHKKRRSGAPSPDVICGGTAPAASADGGGSASARIRTLPYGPAPPPTRRSAGKNVLIFADVPFKMRHAPLKQRKLPPYGSWLRLFAADACGQVGQKRRRRAARGEDQLVLCARHAHIKEPALLFRIRVCRAERRRIAVQKGAPFVSFPHKKRTGARDHIHPQKTQGSSAPFPHKRRTGARYVLPRTECARRPPENTPGAPVFLPQRAHTHAELRI